MQPQCVVLNLVRPSHRSPRTIETYEQVQLRLTNVQLKYTIERLCGLCHDMHGRTHDSPRQLFSFDSSYVAYMQWIWSERFTVTWLHDNFIRRVPGMSLPKSRRVVGYKWEWRISFSFRFTSLSVSNHYRFQSSPHSDYDSNLRSSAFDG
jgi:hypothetical protein